MLTAPEILRCTALVYNSMFVSKPIKNIGFLKMNQLILMFMAVLMVSGVSQAQGGEGVACIPGNARFSCQSGLSCATYGPGDLTGKCLDLQNDGMNCGAISTMCAEGSICSNGSCATNDPICDPTDDSCYGGMPPLAALHPFRLKPMKLIFPRS